ncbi:MAG: hypothetical protein OXE99_13190 [Cellvibrionales bacterium]|nr:hypothetical protein [Cellvibrionales bacterium]
MLSPEGKLQSLEWMGLKPLQSRQPLPNAQAPLAYYTETFEKLSLARSAQSAKLGSTPLSALLHPAEESSPPTPDKQAVAVPVPTPINHILPKVTIDSERNNTAVPADFTAKPNKTMHEALKPFRVRYILIDNVLCLLNQPKRQWSEQQSGLRFLTDVVMAMNKQLPKTTITDTFQWPTAKGLPDDDWALVAEIMLNFFRGQLHDDLPSLRILFFGWEAFFEKDPLRENVFVSVFDKLYQALSCQKSFYALAPLPQYLNDPIAKYQLWQTLQMASEAN